MEGIEKYNLAVRAPKAQEDDMDDYMVEQADIGDVVVPEKHALHVEGSVSIAILVDPV